MNEAETAAQQIEAFTADAQKTMNEGMEKMSQSLEDVASFGQGNVDAVMKTGQVLAKTVETMNAEIMAFAKKSMEDSMAAVKELTSAKSVTEFMERQTSFVKDSFDAFVAQSSKMSDLYLAAAKDVAAPLGERVQAAAEKVKTLNN